MVIIRAPRISSAGIVQESIEMIDRKKKENVLEINDIDLDIWKVKLKGRRIEGLISHFAVSVKAGEPPAFFLALKETNLGLFGKIRQKLGYRWFKFRHMGDLK